MLGKKRVGAWGGFPFIRSQTSEHVGEEESGWVGFPISYLLPYWGTHCPWSFIQRIWNWSQYNITNLPWRSAVYPPLRSAVNSVTQSTSHDPDHILYTLLSVHPMVSVSVQNTLSLLSFIVIIHLYTFSGWKFFQSMSNLHFSYFLTFLPLGVLCVCRSDLYKDHTS